MNHEGHECEELLRTYPKSSELTFKEMEFHNPELAMGTGNKNVIQFKMLCQKYNIDINLHTQEWLTLECNFAEHERVSLSKLDLDELGFNICKSKHCNDDLVFFFL